MSTELTKYQEAENQDLVPRTPEQLKAQRARVVQIMSDVMQKDIHYGTIPGTPKPTLLKPGAEMLLSTFHIAAEPRAEDIADLSTPDKAHYRVRVEARHMVTGILMGAAVGECSSDEEKYKWRKPVCEEEFNDTPVDRKREIWKKGYGDKPAYKTKQVRTNPADVANTILQMAVKRAIVPVTRLVLACSDVFEQDLEDLPAEIRENLVEGKAGEKKVDEPKKKNPAKVEPPKCPECGGPMWDNRQKKTNDKAPDYKCRKKDCKGVYWPGQWPPKEETTEQKPATTENTDPEGCTKDPLRCDFSSHVDPGEGKPMKVLCGEGGPDCKYAVRKEPF